MTKRVLILGASGMLGSAIYRTLVQIEDMVTIGSERGDEMHQHHDIMGGEILSGVDATRQKDLTDLFHHAKPDIVVNCIGLIKQHKVGDDPISAIATNALLPHQIHKRARDCGAQMIHFSTDCVFAGTKGLYTEQDVPDAQDLYGRSKLLGEVSDTDALTLRTSIIGHELKTRNSLLEWFMASEKRVMGFTDAIFSGLTTIELSRLVVMLIHRMPSLGGLFHVAAAPISKYDLLTLVAKIYGKQIEIIPDMSVKINRSLSAERLYAHVGYRAPSWPEMIGEMHNFEREMRV